jgi:hypothetical protein
MLDEIRGIYYTLFLIKPTKQWLHILAFGVLTLMISSLTYTLTIKILTTSEPVITLYSPTNYSETDQGFTKIIGKVEPGDSEVKISNSKIPTNSAGIFTYEKSLQEGDNNLEIVAYNLWKKSTYPIYISYNPKIRDIVSVPATDSPVSEQILGEATSTVLDDEELRQSMIMDVQEVKVDGKVVLKGRLENKTEKTIGWVKITTNFKDEVGEILDTVTTYATGIDQYLAPKANVPFVMPSTDTLYTTYDFKLEYEKMP